MLLLRLDFGSIYDSRRIVLRYNMPDITMCRDTTCPQNGKCYRYVALPNPYRQSYFMSSPKKMDGCDYYWPLKEQNESGSRYRNGSISQEDTLGSN